MQIGNGNVSSEGDAENLTAFGGDTDAESGDADGGDGGDAEDIEGGDALAANVGDQDADNDADLGDLAFLAIVADAGGDTGVIQDNDLEMTQGANTATGGAATGTGGDGGDADTGNHQDTNGNVVVDGENSNVQAFGGDTTAESDDADGGDGGDAEDIEGGDAIAGNIGIQDADNDADVDNVAVLALVIDAGGDTGVIQDNDLDMTQGANTATGGAATGTGGDGGDANTGNEQDTNGNAVVEGDGENIQVFGGDTDAESDDADGGDGGDAEDIEGGDAIAGNIGLQDADNDADLGTVAAAAIALDLGGDTAVTQDNDLDMTQGANTATVALPRAPPATAATPTPATTRTATATPSTTATPRTSRSSVATPTPRAMTLTVATAATPRTSRAATRSPATSAFRPPTTMRTSATSRSSRSSWTPATTPGSSRTTSST